MLGQTHWARGTQIHRLNAVSTSPLSIRPRLWLTFQPVPKKDRSVLNGVGPAATTSDRITREQEPEPVLSEAEGPHAGKYGEVTPLRQRGGSGYDLSLTHWLAVQGLLLMTVTHMSQVESSSVRAAVIVGIFGVIAACFGGIFLLLPTAFEKGFIVIAHSVQGGNPNEPSSTDLPTLTLPSQTPLVVLPTNTLFQGRHWRNP
ncbi:MAG TPA: hypothetical protein VJ124_14945 [Pyrinomonadaceae bacterium]|nr:hypothetical protein [Pyrinomonadaceae bacterium]